jgi:leader peptidase (prepilin peptidase)/N-methyltransferase
VAGVVLGIGVMAVRGAHAGRKTKVPFGPFLALGGLVAIFVGEELVSLYTKHFL